MESKFYKYLVVGGGVAGITAVETIRKNDPSGSIAIVNDQPYLLYSRTVLSKPDFFLGNLDLNQTWTKDQDWCKEKNIDFIGSKKAVSLDYKNKKVILNDGSEIIFEKLLIATGVGTRKLKIPGAEKRGLYYLRTIEDGQAIAQAIKKTKEAVVMGGGFISFEMANLLHLAHIKTTVLLSGDRFWEEIMDTTSSAIVESAMAVFGVKIMKNVEVSEILGSEEVSSIKLSNGIEMSCQMIIAGMGVENKLQWLKDCGILTNKGLVTNEYLETSLHGVWTAGDTAEYKDLILGKSVQMANWVNAREQGRVAGLNMSGHYEPFKFVSFCTTYGFDMSISFIGDVRSDPTRTVIPRNSAGMNSYAQIIVSGQKIIGAILLNRTSEVSTFSKLIEKNIDVSEHYADLADPGFDLNVLTGN